MTLRMEVGADRVAVLTLDRPPVNALDTALRQAVLAAFAELNERDDVGAIVLTGTGRVFCAGADLHEKAAQVEAEIDHDAMEALTRGIDTAVLTSTWPVIAALNGPAVGAGFTLASCCDIRVGVAGGFAAMPEIDRGQGGGSVYLLRVVPQPLVRRMVLTGDRVSYEDLARVGTLDSVVEFEHLLAEAHGLAARIAAKPAEAVRAVRKGLVAVEELGFDDAVAHEQAYTRRLSLSPAAAVARDAFLHHDRP